jgi:hypothetical protein
MSKAMFANSQVYKTIQKKGAGKAEVWYLQVRQSRIRAIPPNQNISGRLRFIRSGNIPG